MTVINGVFFPYFILFFPGSIDIIQETLTSAPGVVGVVSEGDYYRQFDPHYVCFQLGMGVILFCASQLYCVFHPHLLSISFLPLDGLALLPCPACHSHRLSLLSMVFIRRRP